MYTGLQHAHSGWAYLVVIVMFLATANALIKFFGKKEYGGRDMSLALGTLIVTHIQLLLGLILWAVSPNGLSAIQTNGMGGLSSAARQLAVEHPFTMLVVAALITIGYSKHKKKRISEPKFKTLAIFYTISFLLVMTMIPWAQWM